ncbi:MAG: exo-alpha-sialidase, partial [Chloroflexota bacterium]|nr:exo-alpha-sialidase [Chloroflexota bacterium]
MRLIRLILPVGALCGALLFGVSLAGASTFMATLPTKLPDHPFSAGCEGAPQTGTVFSSSEVEPWVDASGTHVVGVFQQDRFSNGGARGLVAAVSNPSGWSVAMAPFSRCSGGNPSNGGDYERAT